MIRNERISPVQLSFIMIGFIFGSSAIITPAVSAYQDAWLAYIIGWIGGYILIGIYAYISILNPSKTFIEILKDVFGKYIGSIIGIFYIWYFLHLAGLVFRNLGEFMIVSIYTETPLIFIIISIALVLAYSLKKGLEVIARVGQIIVPMMLILVISIFLLVMGHYEVKNLLPFLEHGFLKVLKVSFSVLTFPFGETVVFLMIFPYLNDKKDLFKTSYISLTVIGMILLSVVMSNLMILGADMLNRQIFPSHITISLIPGIAVEPFIAINLIIAASMKITMCLYASLIGIAQLFGLDDYKPFINPVVAIAVVISIWVYDSLSDMVRWAGEIYPYYVIPFQIIIPLLVLIILKIKRRDGSSAL
ncbi:spore germination protein KB [Caloranaerobacter azorensis DSM 13643]|uniref:Spore germination protein KB n=1 Tax=Caloranaerobacter azorensis DSM 13643 TaxID=1121264 RepID=A0A1M5UQN1_9FIRM|nr:endospore germination permease [Caloranaerobacter azorensis]SHH65250.1 spore germination protein KB [Caloranaerobacter azorensis DSM 13643]